MRADWIRSSCLLLLAVLATGCSSEYGDIGSPSSPNPVTLSNGSMGAQIDGTSWNADGGIGLTHPFANSPYLSLNGSDRNAWTVALAIANPVQGTQPLTQCYFSNSKGNWSSGGGSGSGEITFTTLTSTNVVGTFSCSQIPPSDDTAKGTKNITSGKFDVRF